MPDTMEQPTSSETSPQHAVTLLPGDGIGPEVVGATQRVIEAASIKIA